MWNAAFKSTVELQSYIRTGSVEYSTEPVFNWFNVAFRFRARKM